MTDYCVVCRNEKKICKASQSTVRQLWKDGLLKDGVCTCGHVWNEHDDVQPSNLAPKKFCIKFGKSNCCFLSTGWDDLLEKISGHWPKLEVMRYSLFWKDKKKGDLDKSSIQQCDETHAENRHDSEMEIQDQSTLNLIIDKASVGDTMIHLSICVLCKGFSEFEPDEALEYACVEGKIDIDDSVFEVANIAESETLSCGFSLTVQQLIDHVAQDIILKLPVFGPLEMASETTVREFISPVLLAAATIAKNMRIMAEKQITGKLGNGPVDYDAIYRDFNICICEAKKGFLDKALGQNIAQLVASREEWVAAERRKGQPRGVKRKWDTVASEIERVPTSGIISCANSWMFTRYTMYPKPKLVRSNAILLTIEPSTSIDQLKTRLTIIIRKIVGIFQLQQMTVDSFYQAKKVAAERRPHTANDEVIS